MRTPSGPTLADNFLRRTSVVVSLLVAITLLLLLAWRIRDIFVLLFAGILLGVFLTGISGWIRQHTPLSHRQALALVVLMLLAIIGITGWLTSPNLIEQGQRLQENLQESLQGLQAALSNQSWAQPILNRLPDPQQDTSLANLLNRLSGLFSRTFDLFTSAVVILFVGFYLAVEPDRYANGLIKLVPLSRRRRAGEVLDEVAHALRWWLVGRLASMLLLGLLWLVGLLLLGIPLALTLAVLAGALSFIPIIGPVLALIPTVLIAFAMGPTRALYVLLLYIGIQVVESYFVTPIIQRKTVALPPVLLIMSQVIFGLLFGFLGLMVAAPVAAMLLVLTKMLYIKDILGDENTELLKEDPEPHFAASTRSRRDGEGEERRVQQANEEGEYER